MFGYITVNKQELKFREFGVYQSYYCGFCRVLKEKYGICGQLTLSYDLTFLILLLSGLYEPETLSSHCRCAAHPFERHPVRRNLYTDYAADMNLLFSYYKLMDDWCDEKKVLSRSWAGLLEKKRRQAVKDYPGKAALFEEKLDELHRYEARGETDVDAVSGCFGEILGEIFVMRRDEWEDTLRRMGFYFGKFIYLMDAYEDLEKDIKNHSYNPFLSIYKSEDFEKNCAEIMTMMMAECCRAFELLPILENADILRNILYSGVWSRYQIIKEKRKARDNG